MCSGGGGEEGKGFEERREGEKEECGDWRGVQCLAGRNRDESRKERKSETAKGRRRVTIFLNIRPHYRLLTHCL